jgi:DNA-binding beta-propeller fold protein YncE
MRRPILYGCTFNTRAVIINTIRLIPALIVTAVMLDSIACGKASIFRQGSGTATPTSTSTGTGAFGYVTNFNDAKVSSFTRNVNTGALKRSGTVTAGAKSGPKGLAVSAGNGFLYVANNKDDNIYQFAVSSSDGKLTPLSPASVSNGSGSGPEQIAMNTNGTLLWVTGSGDGTVTPYTVNVSTGQLTKGTRTTGLNGPLGIAVDSTNSFVYVADSTAGLIYSFSFNTTTGTLTQVGSPLNSLGTSAGNPDFVAIDPALGFIYVDDFNAGVLSVIQTTSGVLSFGAVVPSSTSSNGPLGIGVTNTGGNEFVLTANQGGGTVWAFLVQALPTLAPPVAFGSVSSPTGLVVDPQNQFVYTANQGDGTVTQFQLNVACPTTVQVLCQIGSISTESSGTTSNGPYGIVLSH